MERWRAETTPEDLRELACFAAEPRKHIRFREGDFFRFRINRRLWGYGQILLDYGRIRKSKEPFWDVMMCKPVVCAFCRIATPRRDLTPEEADALPRLPSSQMMDNLLFYGGFEIIGHLPVRVPDYPIHYGAGCGRDPSPKLQCGSLYRIIEGGTALFDYRFFENSGVGYYPDFRLDILEACIRENSNEPYWRWTDGGIWAHDLRDPKYRAELAQVAAQFGIPVSLLLPQAD